MTRKIALEEALTTLSTAAYLGVTLEYISSEESKTASSS